MKTVHTEKVVDVTMKDDELYIKVNNLIEALLDTSPKYYKDLIKALLNLKVIN